MKYTQPHRQYNVSVLTDALNTALPPDVITQMRYDRETDNWVSICPSNFVYPRARELVKQYRREYAQTCEE